jgi:hypothetical protein
MILVTSLIVEQMFRCCRWDVTTPGSRNFAMSLSRAAVPMDADAVPEVSGPVIVGPSKVPVSLQ